MSAVRGGLFLTVLVFLVNSLLDVAAHLERRSHDDQARQRAKRLRRQMGRTRRHRRRRRSSSPS